MTSKHSTRAREMVSVDISEDVAAKLVRRFLRDPFSEGREPRLTDLTADEGSGLQELLRALDTTEAELRSSSILQARAVAALMERLGSSSLTPQRAQSARERLGDSGRLPHSEYLLDIPADALKETEKWGERRAYLETAVRQPDAVQHLSPGAEEVGQESPGMSLFVRRVVQAKGGHFAHLLIAKRAGRTLTYTASWRIFPDVIPWDSDTTPLGLLVRFANHYGLPVRLGDTAVGTFFLYRAIPVADSGKTSWSVDNPDNRPFFASMWIRSASKDVLDVSLAYAVDTSKYAADVKAHIP